MGDKSGVSEQIISVPQGGGALKGIGEGFSPDLHTGVGTFTVPIALPPGRNGLQPALRLAYSTGTGNGSFGFGWAIGIPGVARRTSRGIPTYHDEADTFLLSGAEDLVPVKRLEPAEPGGERTGYLPRTEGLFAQIDHERSAAGDYWEVRSKDGLTSVYGTPRPASAAPSWTDPAALADPADARRIAAWRLTETRDPFGNRVLYDYERDAGSISGRRWNQLYLKRIRYVDFGEPQAQQFLISVEFSYEDRPDPFSDYRSAFETRTTRRCKRIEIFTHAFSDLRTRRYELTYLDERAGAPAFAGSMPPNKASLLSQLTVIGDDGAVVEAMPPVDFGYTAFAPQARKFAPLTGPGLPATSLAHANLELADLFGTGLPDIFELGASARYWRNCGAGRFDSPRMMGTAPAGLRLGDPNVLLLDANGDGRVDLLVNSTTLSGYYPMRFDGTWDARSFRRYRQAPSFDLKDPEVKLLDLTGDGVTDALRSGQRLEAFFNDPEAGWTRTRQVERRALEGFPDINFSDPLVKWGDMSGDGMQDIVLVRDGACMYWPNLGYGDWGPPVHMRASPRFPFGYDPRRILLADVDGDGAADLVYIDDRQVTLWINQSGNGWSEPFVIGGTPPISDADSVRMVDMLGTGVCGVLWSADLGGAVHRGMHFLDFTGGVKPYLLNEMDNHIGAITRVGYAPSTRFLLEDQKKPATRWRTPLPFPVQVVERVEIVDELSRGKRTTEYRYHHGYWDGAEREFRGFGMVENIDSETFERYSQGAPPGTGGGTSGVLDARRFSPPTCSRTWFHQGPVGEERGDWTELALGADFWPGDPGVLNHTSGVDAFLRTLGERRMRRDALRALRGSILRSELYAWDGTPRADRPYTVIEKAYGLRQEAVSIEDGARAVFFAHPVASRTTQWERGDDPLTRFTFTETRDYDAFGQPQVSTSIACPRGWRTRADRPAAAYLATRTRTTYAHPSGGAYLHDRVALTTAYELAPGRPSTLDELRLTPDGDPSLALFGRARYYYDGPAFVGLPSGEVGAFGALTRTETLVLTEATLAEVYRSGDSPLQPPEQPPYLDPSGTIAWPAEYPIAFQDQLPPDAGYTFRAGGPSPDDVPGYFVQSMRRCFDFQEMPASRQRGLVVARRDPLGRDRRVEFDAFDLLPLRVTDPAGMATRAEFDYRVLQPMRIVDANGNEQAFVFSPLGLLTEIYVRGRAGEGDQVRPGTRLTYDFRAFADSKRRDPRALQPIYVHTSRRVHHDTQTDVPPSERDETLEIREFSDGFARLLQSRAQAEDLLFGDPVFGETVLPADQADEAGTRAVVTGRQRAPGDPPNVVVSGWQVYDNKGRVIEKFEPFYATGFDYLGPGDAQLGQKIALFLDPLGRVVRTVHPDGSEQRVVFGVPGTIAAPDYGSPDRFEPTPWAACAYDANDNAGRTHSAPAAPYRHHWDTPSSSLVDALGRVVRAVERNRAPAATPGGPLPPIEEIATDSRYDIRGNLLTLTDALGRVAFTHAYDLVGRPWRVQSIDAGTRRTVLDASGNAVERRDSKGTLVLGAFDDLDRPTHLWARDLAAEAVALRERMFYGDDASLGLSAQQVASGNLLGRLFQHYDEAGRLALPQYDFKGSVVEKSRQVISATQILSVFAAPAADWVVQAYRVDWAPDGDSAAAALAARAAALLDPASYQTSVSLDALDRATAMRIPRDVLGQRRLLQPRYNRAGALEGVSLDGETYVAHIAYSAKGKRSFVAYGNGVMTRQAYDPRTFFLSRLRTESFVQEAAGEYRPSGGLLQDLGYDFDLAGNLLAMHDRAPGSGVPASLQGMDALDRSFAYDALYRLVSATGRECDRPPDTPWDASFRCTDLTRTRAYAQQYRYDAAGNVLQLKHSAGGAGFTRDFTPAADVGNVQGNRIGRMSVSGIDYDYGYDPNGNLTSETDSRHFEWDHADRMRAFQTRIANAEPTAYVHYLYDASGRRTSKLLRKAGGATERTVYIDGLFEHQEQSAGGSIAQNDTLHVMDSENRVALVRAGAAFAGDAAPPVKYQLGDHLGSSYVVVGGATSAAGIFIDREEYTPFGETSFGSFARKRYRFTGKERDEESGLSYHHARYYAPWLLRWIAADPLMTARGPSASNLYLYVKNNPLLLVDPRGLDAEVSTSVDGCSFADTRPGVSSSTDSSVDGEASSRGAELRKASATKPNLIDAPGAASAAGGGPAPGGTAAEADATASVSTKSLNPVTKAQATVWVGAYGNLESRLALGLTAGGTIDQGGGTGQGALRVNYGPADGEGSGVFGSAGTGFAVNRLHYDMSPDVLAIGATPVHSFKGSPIAGKSVTHLVSAPLGYATAGQVGGRSVANPINVGGLWGAAIKVSEPVSISVEGGISHSRSLVGTSTLPQGSSWTFLEGVGVTYAKPGDWHSWGAGVEVSEELGYGTTVSVIVGAAFGYTPPSSVGLGEAGHLYCPSR